MSREFGSVFIRRNDMNKKKMFIYAGIAVVVIIGIILVMISGRQEINFEIFAARTGIKSVEDVEYVMFYIEKEDRTKRTTYYITDRDLIHKMYDIFDKTVYTRTKADYFKNYKTDFLYKLTFCQTLEKNRNLTVFGYYVESDDSLLAWPTVESNYGTGEDDFWDYGIDHYVVKVDTDLCKELQKICENDLSYITMEEIEKILEKKENLNVLDFYGFIHEQTGKYEPNEEPAENLYDINRMEIADYEGYLELRNQYETVHSENIEECRWYHDILSIALYNNNGELQEILYEKQELEEE